MATKKVAKLTRMESVSGPMPAAAVRKLRWFKVLMQRGKQLTGGYSTFDYSPYLPKGGKPGKPLPVMKPLAMCNRGWHVTAHPKYWADKKSLYGLRVFEVRLLGKVRTDGSSHVGADEAKICAESIQLVREIVQPKPSKSEYDTILDYGFQKK